MFACRASRVSIHAALTTRSEIEISSIRLIIRADALYALRYCSMAKRTVSRSVPSPSIGRIWPSSRSARTLCTTARKISRFDLKCT